MKVLFLNPPSPNGENVIRDSIYGCWCRGRRIAGAITPPYPQVLLATVARNHGHQVQVVDAVAHRIGMGQLEGLALEHDVVVILTSVMTFAEDRQVLSIMKKANPGLTTILYGALPTFMPGFCLRFREVDFIIRREAEQVLVKLLKVLGEGGSLGDVNGIGYRDNHQPQINPLHPFISNLDELPLPEWSLLPPAKDYFNPLVLRHPYVTELTSRGCPGKCTFCMAPGFYGKRVRMRSAQVVVEAFRRYKALGFKEIYLRDEMFTTSKRRVREICERLIAEKIDLTWLCSAKIGSLDRETLALMRRAGCHTIKFGVESGSQQILDNVKKGITIAQTEQTFAWCHEVGLRTHAHMLVGCPGETPHTLRQSIALLKRIRPTTVTFGILTPYPGTPIYEQVLEKYPHLRDEYNLPLEQLHTTGFYTDAFCDIPPEELAYWVKWAHRRFYLRPGYVLEWLGRVHSWGEFMQVVRAGMKVVQFAIVGD